MKFFTKKSMAQKIIITCILLLLVNFSIAPLASYAKDDDWSLGGSIAKEFIQMAAWFGDVIMGALNNFMLGANTGFGGMGSAMLSKDNNPNLENSESWLYAGNSPIDVEIPEGEIDTSSFWPGIKYEIPNMLYSPENIFANNIAALDVNFLRANEYESVFVSGDGEFSNAADRASESAATKLRSTIAEWYNSFRNIAVVGLLSILIYLGIRILLGSTASDKAKYKETLRDWVVALCLVFVIHFIMSGILMLTDQVTKLFASEVNEGIVVKVGSDTPFRTNFMGLVRFRAQSSHVSEVAAYTLIYIALVTYTIMFTFMYFRRFLYMAFFTMIAPLVAITYPIDRAGDGKAQAFNMWFKEYTMNAVIQPIHLILYSVFVQSAIDLAIDNPIYALVAIGFLTKAEGFVKKMFGLTKAETPSGFGSFAAGALGMNALKKLAGVTGGKSGGKNATGGESSKGEDSGSVFIPPASQGGLESITGANNNPNIGAGEPPQPGMPGDNGLNPEPSGDNGLNPGQPGGQPENTGMGGQQGNGEGNLDDDSWHLPQHQEVPEQSLWEGSMNHIKDSVANSKAGNWARNSQNVLARTGRGAYHKTKALSNSYAGRVAKRGLKAGGKQVWKMAKKAPKFTAKVGGALTGAVLAGGAMLTTGDPSKVFQGVAVGMAAGSAIGGNTANAIGNAGAGAVNTIRTARNVLEEEKYGMAGARELERKRQNKKARREFLKNDKEKRKYRDLAGKMGYNGDVKSLMKAAADYKEAGIADDSVIHGALQAEYARNGTVEGNGHKKFVDIASYAQDANITRKDVEDEKARKTFEGKIATNAKLKGNVNAQREVAQTIADIYDVGDLYRSVSNIGRNPTPTPSNQPTPTPSNRPRPTQNPNTSH